MRVDRDFGGKLHVPEVFRKHDSPGQGAAKKNGSVNPGPRGGGGEKTGCSSGQRGVPCVQSSETLSGHTLEKSHSQRKSAF